MRTARKVSVGALAVIATAFVVPITSANALTEAGASQISFTSISADPGPDILDPILCPQFITVGGLTGGRILGVIAIDSDGDVSTADVTGPGYTKQYNCPPY